MSRMRASASDFCACATGIDPATRQSASHVPCLLAYNMASEPCVDVELDDLDRQRRAAHFRRAQPAQPEPRFACDAEVAAEEEAFGIRTAQMEIRIGEGRHNGVRF